MKIVKWERRIYILTKVIKRDCSEVDFNKSKFGDKSYVVYGN